MVTLLRNIVAILSSNNYKLGFYIWNDFRGISSNNRWGELKLFKISIHENKTTVMVMNKTRKIDS